MGGEYLHISQKHQPWESQFSSTMPSVITLAFCSSSRPKLGALPRQKELCPIGSPNLVVRRTLSKLRLPLP
ncbi:hypothetical protein Scep_000664 [Stephania cephalantha]|uniref:Uncharacterized protein n=1 Tax=Stephania cephalantha TaxID=152367 RepID=A0AAP0Q384_9MAGN